LNQRPMVASVTDSPSVGTRISVIFCFLNSLNGHRPRRRTIQYSAMIMIERDGTDYWMPRFRGA
jgi:hypothetical protein